MSTRVLVIPGLAASDHSTQLIRSSLALRGHKAQRWRLGRNTGPSEETAAGLSARLDELHRRDGEPVALVGWSLGGLYSHWLAREKPHLVHSVTTLGSPLGSSERSPRALSVPTTSVYTKGDRVVPWQRSLLDTRFDRHENVEVRGSHFSLGFDPAVLHLITDRVEQDPGSWTPFRPPLIFRPAFPAAADPEPTPT